MENQFAFLAQARPAGLYRLLEKLPMEDAAIALAGLPPGVGVQVMAYFPEDKQPELMQAMRDARRVPPERAAKTAAGIRDVLMKAKYARDGHADAAPPASEAAPAPAAQTPAPKPSASSPVAKAYAPQSAAPRTREAGKPTPWVPRTATASPINGPALPGSPPPVAGDPFKSPLAKAGLMDLLSRARDKLLPKAGPAATPPPTAPVAKAPAAVSGKPERSGRSEKAERSENRPAPREGVARSVPVGKTPRVIGPAAGKGGGEGASGASGGRSVDGKAILAAILRAAGPEVRGAVQRDDPALMRELRGRMFFFDDLIYTEDGALARVFTAAPTEESALALQFAAPALRDRVLRVVSPGRADALRDAPRRRAGLDDIEAAQKKVLAVALQLQAAGRILIDPRDPDLAGR